MYKSDIKNLTKQYLILTKKSAPGIIPNQLFSPRRCYMVPPKLPESSLAGPGRAHFGFLETKFYKVLICSAKCP